MTRRDQGTRGFSPRAPTAALVAALLAGGCCGGSPPRPNHARAQPRLYSHLRDRQTNHFANCFLFKPVGPASADVAYTFSPLLLEELAKDATIDGTNRAGPVWCRADSMVIAGRTHARLAYTWRYASSVSESARGSSAQQRGTAAVPASSGRGQPLQGVSITLGSNGQPLVWEALTDDSGARVIFVAQSLEEMARAEHGSPLPGRQHSVERSISEAPDVVVARVIDDGPVPMGPIVYLEKTTHNIATLICRCMPAQAKTVAGTGTYELVRFEENAGDSRLKGHSAAGQPAEWPSAPNVGPLEKLLRLPRGF